MYSGLRKWKQENREQKLRNDEFLDLRTSFNTYYDDLITNIQLDMARMKERRNAYNELVAKVYRMITRELHTFLTLTLYDSERSA
jgi:flagellar hook-associated protein FlgK